MIINKTGTLKRIKNYQVSHGYFFHQRLDDARKRLGKPLNSLHNFDPVQKETFRATSAL